MTQQRKTTAMFCRHCGYNLYGLSENRCPECGNTFNPADPATFCYRPHQRPWRRWIAARMKYMPLAAATGLLLASWASLMAGPATMLFTPAALFGTCLLFRRKYWVLVPLMIVLNPLSIGFLEGVSAYWKGSPSLRFMGLPSIESYNPDPETRCFWSGGGCVIRGNEWVWIEPHNLAVRLMASIFGPPAASYRGPYPTKEEAMELVADAPKIDISDLLADRIPCGDQTVRLESGVGSRLLSGLRLVFDNYVPSDPESETQATAAIHKNQCVILRLQQAFRELDLLVLLDANKGKPFAYYLNSTRYDPHFPPARYTDPPGN